MIYRYYTRLLQITLMATIVCYLMEIQNPTELDLNQANHLGLFLCRFLHLLSFLYFTFFLVLFDVKSVDSFLYLCFAVLLCISWKCFDCCILSYYELKMYHADHRHYLTSFHPCLHILFGRFQETALVLMAIMMTFTFSYILFRNRSIPFFQKAVLGSLFGFFFLENIVQTRIYKNRLEYPKHGSLFSSSLPEIDNSIDNSIDGSIDDSIDNSISITKPT